MSERDLEPLDGDIAALLAGADAETAPAAARERVRARLAQSISGPGNPGDGGDDPGGDGGADPGGASGASGGPAASPGDVAGAGAVVQAGSASVASSSGSGLWSAIAAKPALLAAVAFGLGAGTGATTYAVLDAPAASAPQSATITADRPPGEDPGVAPAMVAGDGVDAGSHVAPRDGGSEQAGTRTPGARPLERPAVGASADDRAEQNSRRDAVLAAERASLDRARTALSTGEPATALDHLQRHAEQFPAGQLIQEREALWIQALVGIGATRAAAARARQFLERFPDSVFAPVVRGALKESP